MSQGVMIRGRYVSKNRPIALVGVSVVMGVVAGVNLGIGVNTYCDNSWDDWCTYQKNAYIISGSCFLVSSVLFLVAAISLHHRIKKALTMREVVVVQQVNPPSLEHFQQPTNVVVAHYPPPVVPTPYPPPDTNNAPPVGFAAYQQSVPPAESYPKGYPEQQPPPYSP